MAFLRPLSQPKAMTGGADSRSDNDVNSTHGSAPPFCKSSLSKITLRLLSTNCETAKTPDRSSAGTQSANEHHYKQNLCVFTGARPLGPENRPIVGAS